MLTSKGRDRAISIGGPQWRVESNIEVQRNMLVRSAVGHYLDLAGHSVDTRQAHLLGSQEIAELEGKLERFYGMRYALAVANATLGLFAIALALNLRESEFVTTPYTYGASLGGWLLLRNRPAFADVDPETLTLDPRSAHRLVSRRTRALLAVDIYGVPSDSLGLRRVADEHGLWYISDAAESLGATRRGEPASTRADALVVSFTTGKTLFAGEGGAILTNNEELYQRLIWHCQHPYRQRREIGLHVYNEYGLNARIHPLAAVWANAAFDESLSRLRDYQQSCMQIIDALNEIGLTQEIHYRENQINPSFFRLTAAWKGIARDEKLASKLLKHGFRLRAEQAPLGIVYRQPAFVAQYKSLLTSSPACPRAEQQTERRFCLN